MQIIKLLFLSNVFLDSTIDPYISLAVTGNIILPHVSDRQILKTSDVTLQFKIEL